MVRCRWCNDITCAGEPDDYHIQAERECPHKGEFPEYLNLGIMTHRNKEEEKLYIEYTNDYIKDQYPDYWKELEELRKLNK